VPAIKPSSNYPRNRPANCRQTRGIDWKAMLSVLQKLFFRYGKAFGYGFKRGGFVIS